MKAIEKEIILTFENIESKNDLYNVLKNFKNYIYHNNYSIKSDTEIIDFICNTLNFSEALQDGDNISSVFGVLEGKKNIDILYISLEIIDFFKYSSDFIKTIQFLFEISRSADELIQSKALQIISNLCDYNLKIIKDKGYEIQLKIIEIIEKQSDIELLTNLNPINVSLSTLLELNINRVAIHNPKSITIYNNQDEIIVILKNIRKKSINILKKLYFLAKNDIEKKIAILKALSKAFPYGNNINILWELISTDCNKIIEFYQELVLVEDLIIIGEIEKQKSILGRVYKDKLPKIEEISKAINSNSEYQIFKFILDYNFDLLENKKIKNWSDYNKYQKETINNYLISINEDNMENWIDRIIYFIRVCERNIDKINLSNFINFLYSFGIKFPEVSYEILISRESELNERLIISLMDGLQNSKKNSLLIDLLYFWANSNIRLKESSLMLAYLKDKKNKATLFTLIFNKAKELEDFNILDNLIFATTITNRFTKNLKSKFFDLLEIYFSYKKYSWLNKISNYKIFSSLNETDVDIILENLILLNKLDESSENFLISIAKNNPEKIIRFFYNRVSFHIKNLKNLNLNYEVFPYYQFIDLLDELIKYEDIILKEFINFESNAPIEDFLLGNLIGNFFPSISPKLKIFMENLISLGDKKDLRKIIILIRVYNGSNSINEICKKIIKKYPEEKENIFYIMSDTGVVIGRDGFLNEYKNKKNDMEIWKNDPDISISTFAVEYQKFLDELILFEEKRIS